MSDVSFIDSLVRPGLRRGFYAAPAFNCGPEGRDCKHKLKGDHGIHGEDWYYVVSNGTVAAQLLVFSGIGTTGDILHRPIATSLSFHVDFLPEESDIRELKPHRGDCKLVEQCFGTIGYGALYARDLFEALLRQYATQSEELWLALENFFVTELPNIDRRRAEMSKISRCSHCNGEGLIRR